MPRLHDSIKVSGAFTVVEMLIVIGILMLLLGLTAGAVLRSPRVDAVVGTEQLLTDMIRQARHTARSTGGPVLLQISAANRTIMGVSQIPVWSETFEEGSSFTLWDSPYGQTGRGWTNPGGSPPPPPPSFPIPHNQALTRNAAATSGFYLTCAVNLPDVNVLTTTSPADLMVVPLVLVGTQTDATATCGLALRWKQVAIQTVYDSSGTNVLQSAQYAVWDVIGWVNDATNGMVQVASVENTVFTPVMMLSQSGPSHPDVSGPIVGGRWEDLGLLFDGTNLELMRNGEEIASLVAVNPGMTTSPDAARLTGVLVDTTNGNGPQTIYPAAAAMPSLEQPILVSNPPTSPMSYVQGTLDNCRLFRLGTERPTVLPSGMVPQDNYTMRVRPDGIVEFRGSAATTSLGGTLGFTMVHSASAPGVSDSVQITVNPDGSVVSMVAAGENSTSAAGVQ